MERGWGRGKKFKNHGYLSHSHGTKVLKSIMNNLSITEIARLLRKNQTQQEKKLWKLLRGKQIGFKIRRQHPLLDHYIIDFY
jgi:very-short-patch-repair endonuclease